MIWWKKLLGIPGEESKTTSKDGSAETQKTVTDEIVAALQGYKPTIDLGNPFTT